MATSKLLRATDQNTSQENMINNPNEPTKPRGRKTSRSQAAPKKQPQRGLGVAQLEQLRIQEQYEQPSPPPPPLVTFSNQFQGPLGNVPVLHYDPGSYINGRPVMIDASSSCEGGSLEWDQGGGGLVVQRSRGNGNGYLMGVNPYPYAINGASDPTVVQLESGHNRNRTLMFENSKELSSIPKFPCVPDRCEFCFKRTRFNVSNNLGFDEGGSRNKNIDLISPTNVDCDFLGLNLDHKESLAEVKQIHRKGSVVGGKVLMEYEFFPGKGSGSWKNSTGFKKLQFFPTAAPEAPAAAQLGGEASSCITTDHTTSYASSNTLDLSLKLSY